MVKRTRIKGWAMLAVVLLAPLAGCTGGGDPDRRPPGVGEGDKTAVDAQAGAAVVGSFVGKVAGTKAFVAVVAAPAAAGEDSGAVRVYLSDGRGLSESFSGPISGSSFVATSEDGGTEAEGRLSADSVTGTVELPDGAEARYTATPPSGAAGLYELTVSSGGDVSGASAAGLGVTGRITLEKRGRGKLRLVDGNRLELAVTRMRGGETDLRAGRVRLIILSGGELRGVAKGPRSSGGRSDFFVRSV